MSTTSDTPLISLRVPVAGIPFELEDNSTRGAISFGTITQGDLPEEGFTTEWAGEGGFIQTFGSRRKGISSLSSESHGPSASANGGESDDGMDPTMSPADAPGALPIQLDDRAFIDPTDTIANTVGQIDFFRVVLSGPAGITTGILSGLATKALLVAAVVPAIAVAPVVASVVSAAALGSCAALSLGPLRRIVRERARCWYSTTAGSLVDGDFGDPGCIVRDAGADDVPDAADGGVVSLDGAGRPVRRKRARHYVPYSNGKVRGAYLASVVAETRTNYAGRVRDNAAEHGARREMVLRMRGHGMRNTDIDKVREAMVNAVFYQSRSDAANAMLEGIGRRLGLQRGGGSGR